MAKSFNALMADRFKRITASYEKANELVHETGIMILEHAFEHKDCSTAQGLVMAMPASVRREMLILWFSKFSPIVVKNDEKWTSKMHKEGTKLYVPFDIEAAKATPFYRLAEQHKEAAPLDVEGLIKMIEGLSKRLEKKCEKGEVEEECVDSALAAAAAIRKIKIVKKPASNSNEQPAAPSTAKAA